MAVSATAPTVAIANPKGQTLFNVCAYSADASGAEVIKAAPASGAIYIEKMTVFVGAAITFTLGDGEDSSAVETIAWNLAGTAEGTMFVFDFKYPVKLTDLKAFVMDASGAGAVVVNAEGFVA